MAHVAELLEALRQRIEARNEPTTPAVYVGRLAITMTPSGFDLDFYGDPSDESYFDLLDTLASPDIAPHVRSLALRGPDEGANGTQNWDLDPLLAKQAAFSRMETLAIRQNRPGDHNRTIVGRNYNEEGVLGRLLASCPSLQELTVPSAPGTNFFDVPAQPLRYLNVDAGYATESFIHNLANSTTFGGLTSFEWGEYNETYMDDFRSNCTPFEDYHALFRSNAFATVKAFVWRNPVCSVDEIKTLKNLRPHLQLLVVRTSQEYV